MFNENAFIAPCLVPEVENGRVNLFPVNQMVSHGQIIKVDCKPQYELHYNTTEAVCNNSSWTHVPQCVPGICQYSINYWGFQNKHVFSYLNNSKRPNDFAKRILYVFLVMFNQMPLV